ncbi:hypothetical protein YC2023_019501 [Brassica napus]
MHVTDGLSSSSESPQLRSTTDASSLLSSSTEASPLHREGDGEQGGKWLIFFYMHFNFVLSCLCINLKRPGTVCSIKKRLDALFGV